MQNDTTSRDLSNAFRVARRRAWIVVLCVVLGAALAFAYSKTKQKEYTATAQVYFRNAQLDQEAAGLPVVNNVDPQSQTDTNLRLATLPRVAADTSAVVGHGVTPSAIAQSIGVSQVGDTDLATVAATSTSPKLAATIANAYASQVVANSQVTNASYYAKALRALNLQYKALTPTQRRGLQGADLLDRASSLQILAQLQTSDVRLEQLAAVPSSPSSPKVARNTVLGGILGLLLGLGLAFLLNRIDQRIREPGDLEDVYGVPVVGIVPESSALRVTQHANGSQIGTLPPNEAEIFGLLRAHIRYFNVDRELRVVVVVSATPGDGKTTVARNLATATAMVGSRVLLVEADLRRPMVARYFGIKQEPGLSEVLVGAESLESAVQRVEIASERDMAAGLDVLVAGGVLPPSPPQVIESQAMESLLQAARRSYELVVIDTPPLALLPDAFPLVSRADGVLVVSRLGRNRKDVARRLRETLASANAPVIGVVANGMKRSRGRLQGYAYSYDYSAYNGNGSTADANGAVADTSDTSSGLPPALSGRPHER